MLRAPQGCCEISALFKRIGLGLQILFSRDFECLVEKLEHRPYSFHARLPTLECLAVQRLARLASSPEARPKAAREPPGRGPAKDDPHVFGANSCATRDIGSFTLGLLLACHRGCFSGEKVNSPTSQPRRARGLASVAPPADRAPCASPLHLCCAGSGVLWGATQFATPHSPPS